MIPACQKESPDVSPGLNDKFNFSSSEYSSYIQKDFEKDKLNSFLSDSSVKYFDTLNYFYSTRNYEPVFIKSYDDKNLLEDIVKLLNKSVEHGLNPEWYHTKLIEEEFTEAIKDSSVNDFRYLHLSNAEILVADGILKYSYHLRYGVVNPKELFPTSYFLPVADSAKRNLFEPLKQDDIIKYLNKVQPKNEKYVKLQNALKDYKKYENLEWSVLPIPAKKIEIGYEGHIISGIASKLISLGFIDTTKIMINNFSVYDSLLAVSVKDFQRVNGLNDDGVIGKTTIERLNISPKENIDKIKINLERFRWNNYSDTAQYIFVNIPEFKLHLIENKKEIFDIKVCTGKKRPANFDTRYKAYLKNMRWQNKPDDWETPNMYGEISYLILNPTWTVPQSIIREEIFAAVKKDSSYLEKKNFKVYKNGVEIPLSDVSTNQLYSANIPYRIVQNPGAGNALGRIKFMFNNPFGIYLHDTPTRAPFTYSNRAVSHGCIRVEKPLQLAEYILKNHSKWNIDFLKIEIGQTVTDKTKISEYNKLRSELRKNSSYGKTTELKLEKKIPLFIDYYTAWVDKEGRLNFREDVYKKDKILSDYLTLNKNI